MRVGIIGHYGLGLDLANGQTIKTKIVTEAIEKKLGESVYLVDAHGGIKAILPVILGCAKSLSKCKNVMVMLTENGLLVAVPTLCFLNKLFRKKLHYNVIGGWLNSFLDKHSILEKMLKNFDHIYVETSTMKKALENRGFLNIVVMPNCKELSILKDSELMVNDAYPLRICTFSRVMKEKGIEDLVEVVKKINSKKEYLQLDIYGQINSNQIEWFDKLQCNFTESIRYGGVVPFDKSVETLKNYYALVFPTKFYTEGIPGTIIDAYAAGIPVISAKWESFSDVVDDGVTGIGYSFEDLDGLKNVLEKCISNPDILNTMKFNCLKKARNFTVDSAMDILLENL